MLNFNSSASVKDSLHTWIADHIFIILCCIVYTFSVNCITLKVLDVALHIFGNGGNEDIGIPRNPYDDM